METPIVTIEVNMAIEFITAAYAYVNRESGRESSKADILRADSKAVEWFDRVDIAISPYDESGLKLVFSTVSAKILLDFIVGKNDLKDVESLFRFLKEITTEEFVRYFLSILNIEDKNPADLNEQFLIEALEADRGIQLESITEEARQLVRLMEKPERFHRILTESLESFYISFLRNDMPAIYEILIQKQKEHTKILENDPELFLNRLTSGSYGSWLEKAESIRLIPVYLHQYCLDLLMSGSVIIYGLGHDALINGKNVERETEIFIKAISDPNRLTILRLLSNRKWYGKELADRLELSTATVSYHMDKLMTAGLIQLESSEQRKFFYTVNRKGIKDFINSLEAEFLRSSLPI